VDDLLDRRDGVREVDPQQVDVVGAEPAQARLDRGPHVPAAVPGAEDRPVEAVGELRGQGEPGPRGLEQVAQDLLGLAELVAVGGVEERPARVGVPVEDPTSLVRLGAHAPTGAERPRAECVSGDAQAVVAAEGHVLHGSPLASRTIVVLGPYARPTVK
jgi:hypothetical protein